MIFVAFVSCALLQDSGDRLSRAAAQAEAELKEFRLRAAEDEKRQAKTLEEVRAGVQAAATSVVELSEAVSGLREALDVERKERASLAERAESLRDLRERAVEVARAWRSDLQETLASLPPLPAPALKEAVEDPAGEIQTLLQSGMEILGEGGRVRRFKAEVVDPDGRQVSVDLLRAGHVFSAFRDPNGQLAVAVGAPNGDGFRWSTALSRKDRALVEAAFAKPGSTFRLPVDVAQSLTADASLADAGAWAFLASGGPVMIPLGVVAALSLLFCGRRFVFYAREGRHRPAFIDKILELSRGGFFAEAHKMADEMGGVVARVLGSCFAAREGGLRAVESAAQEALLHERPRLERHLSLLAVFAGVAPMLGLLGTVAGIIATFEVIAQIGRGDPSLMAGGISEALVATGTGLFVAIPLVVLHSHFSGRVERIAGDAERYAASLINILGDRAKGTRHGSAA